MIIRSCYNLISSCIGLALLLLYISYEKKGQKNMLKIVKVEKTDKEGKQHTYYNIYLFNVAVKSVDSKQSAKLYYLVKGYLNNEVK